jgi:hypothetical protein
MRGLRRGPTPACRSGVHGLCAGQHRDAAECACSCHGRRCGKCARHYGDEGTCDEGKPVNSPHRIRATGAEVTR